MTVPTTLIKVCIVVFPMRRPFSVDMATLRWAPPFYQPPCSQAPWNATSCPTSASPPPPLPLSSYGNLTESSLNCQESLVVIFDKNLICQNSRIVQKISDGIVVARELISKINMNFFPSFFFILSSSRGIASKFQRSEYSKKKIILRFLCTLSNHRPFPSPRMSSWKINFQIIFMWYLL